MQLRIVAFDELKTEIISRMVSVLLFVYRIYFAQLSSNSLSVKFYAGISSAFNVTDASADNLLDNTLSWWIQ